MLQKAGVKLPWRPKTWNDVLAVTRKVKAANPGVIPFWLHAGVTTGPYVTVVQTLANLIFGSKNPVMLDPKTGKWVVDSPGLRASLDFYKSIFSGGLAESVGQAFNPQAAILVPDFMRKHKVAIALGSNWYPGAWVFKFATPWPTAGKEVAVAPIPTQTGQAPGSATSLAGWCFSIAKVSKSPDLAFGLIKIMEESKNSIDHANWAGFVPPSTKDASSPAFAKFAPPQGEFRNYASFATPVPSDPGYPVYARALSQATGTFAQNPSSSVADAIKSITQTVQQQLGKGKTEVLP
jgi:multiple sugar transport system substrate-binding protein